MDSGTTKLTMQFLCEHRVTNFELTNKGSNVTVNKKKRTLDDIV